MKSRRSYTTNTGFLDLLFNALLLFVTLFILQLLIMNPKASQDNISISSAYIVTVMWPSDYTDDVDTYVEDPVGNLVCFRRKEVGLMNLDRDDLGRRNDILKTQTGTIIFDINKETVFIRETISGEYIVNVHMYRKEDERSTPILIELQKIKPFSIIVSNSLILYNTGEEKTSFRFVVDDEGNVKNINYIDKKIIGKSTINIGAEPHSPFMR